MKKKTNQASYYRIRDFCKGFTLIEVMCVVAITSILASVAIPSFMKYVARAKTLEALGMLRTIFDAEVAWSYHVQKGAGRGASVQLYNPKGTGCNLGVGPHLCYAFTMSQAYDPATGAAPQGKKVRLTEYPPPNHAFNKDPYDWYKSFSTVGVSFDSPTAFAYWTNVCVFEIAALCYNPGQYCYHTFYARATGDLDGDTIASTFQRIGYLDTNLEVQGAAGVYTVDELE